MTSPIDRTAHNQRVNAWLNEVEGAPSEFEALARAARERGDDVAGEMADGLARQAEWS